MDQRRRLLDLLIPGAFGTATPARETDASPHEGDGETDEDAEPMTVDREAVSHHEYLPHKEALAAARVVLEGERDLPCLPLHDAVLYPGETLPLRIHSPDEAHVFFELCGEALSGGDVVDEDAEGEGEHMWHCGRADRCFGVLHEAAGHRLDTQGMACEVVEMGRHESFLDVVSMSA
jgi:hypothetical protein